MSSASGRIMRSFRHRPMAPESFRPACRRLSRTVASIAATRDKHFQRGEFYAWNDNLEFRSTWGRESCANRAREARFRHRMGRCSRPRGSARSTGTPHVPARERLARRRSMNLASSDVCWPHADPAICCRRDVSQEFLQCIVLIGAGGETRTRTPLQATDFESVVYTDSTTPATFIFKLL